MPTSHKLTLKQVYEACAEAADRRVEELTADEKKDVLLNAILSGHRIEMPGVEFITGSDDYMRHVDKLFKNDRRPMN